MGNPSPYHPPKLAVSLLKSFCAEEWQDEILGDLREQFIENCEEKGARKASLQYYYEVIRFIRPHILKKRNHQYFPHC